ncbi:MAG TPA: PAS domain S-box protein, partial [Spirochaetota bacterium]
MALQESEERFSKIFQFSPAGINIFRIADGRSVDVNKAFLNLIDYSREEVIGHTAEELNILVNPDERTDWIQKMRECEGNQNREILIRKKSGLIAELFISIARIELNGEQMGLILAIDITERKRAEEALRESESRFRSVLENSRDIIVRMNMQTEQYEYISPSVETLFGYSPEEAMNFDFKTSQNVIHPDDLPAMMAALELLKKNDKVDIEYRQQTKSGDYIWVSNQMSIIRDSSGQVLYRDANVRDITEDKKAHEALRLTLESIGDGFIACDADWKFVYVNGPAERILGIRRDEIIGRSQWEVFPLTVGTLLEHEYRLAASGEIREFEYFYEPQSRWYHKRCYPRENGGISVYFLDITEQKRTEEELRTNRKLLQNIIDNASALIYVFDLEERLIIANKALADLFHASPEQLIGKKRKEFMP